MNTPINVKTDLDQKVKTIHNLLQMLPQEERMEYIKTMIPSLLSTPLAITDTSQRLAEKHLTPFNNLSKEQHDLMNGLVSQTERLYKMMNDGY